MDRADAVQEPGARHELAGGRAQDEITQADGQLLKVPDGYQAMKATVRLDGNHWTGEYTQFGVVVGTPAGSISATVSRGARRSHSTARSATSR